MKKTIAVLLLLTMLVGLTACGGEKEITMDLEQLYAAFLEKMPEMMQLSEADMLDYMGLSADCYSKAIVAISQDGLAADEVWLIQAKDADTLKQIQELAQTRLQCKGEETENYLPEEYAVVKQGVTAAKGLYFALLVSPEVKALKAEFENAAK